MQILENNVLLDRNEITKKKSKNNSNSIILCGLKLQPLFNHL